VSTGPLPSTGHGVDHIENTSSNTPSNVACAYFGRCLEMRLRVIIYVIVEILNFLFSKKQMADFKNLQSGEDLHVINNFLASLLLYINIININIRPATFQCSYYTS
jgi:hypothetical protein